MESQWIRWRRRIRTIQCTICCRCVDSPGFCIWRTRSIYCAACGRHIIVQRRALRWGAIQGRYSDGGPTRSEADSHVCKRQQVVPARFGCCSCGAKSCCISSFRKFDGGCSGAPEPCPAAANNAARRDSCSGGNSAVDHRKFGVIRAFRRSRQRAGRSGPYAGHKPGTECSKPGASSSWQAARINGSLQFGSST